VLSAAKLPMTAKGCLGEVMQIRNALQEVRQNRQEDFVAAAQQCPEAMIDEVVAYEVTPWPDVGIILVGSFGQLFPALIL
jgi:hypothetical protein